MYTCMIFMGGMVRKSKEKERKRVRRTTVCVFIFTYEINDNIILYKCYKVLIK